MHRANDRFCAEMRHIIFLITILLASCGKSPEEALKECMSYLDTGLIELAYPACESLLNNGNAEVQNKIGFKYINSKNPNDIDKGVHWLEQAAINGDIGAYAQLGLSYEYRPHMRDFEKALYWYKEGALNGNELCAQNLGIIYYEGVKVEQNYLKAEHTH